MSQGSELLRMLEPAVRPVALPGAGAPRPQNQPFEARPFEALLREAGVNADADASAPEPAPSGPDPLAALNGIQAVGNASLRSLIHQTGPTSNPLPDDPQGAKP